MKIVNIYTFRRSGWNNKNTLDFGFDENGNHVICNMDGEIVDTDLSNSPFCKFQWELFKKEYPTKEIYEEKMKELQEGLKQMDVDEFISLIGSFSFNRLKEKFNGI